MVLFFTLVGLGWVLASMVLTLAEMILKRFYPQVGYKSLIILNLLTGGLITFFLYFGPGAGVPTPTKWGGVPPPRGILTPLVNHTFSDVYASGLEPDSEKSLRFYLISI